MLPLLIAVVIAAALIIAVMSVDTILAYDATGGGVMAVVPPTSLTIKKDGYLVGYFMDGISAEEVTITNPNNTAWEAAGFSLTPTSTGAAVLPGLNFAPLPKQVPVRKGDVLVFTLTSGANPVHFGLYVEYPGGISKFELRATQDKAPAMLVTRPTVAGGANCAAGTLVQSATNLATFPQGIVQTPIAVTANATFTTTAILAIRKYAGENVLFMVPIPLTDVAAAWHKYCLPKGLFTVTQGEEIEIFWASVTGEQPTANILFSSAPRKK